MRGDSKTSFPLDVLLAQVHIAFTFSVSDFHVDTLTLPRTDICSNNDQGIFMGGIPYASWYGI
jgi:hypothetical protein